MKIKKATIHSGNFIPILLFILISGMAYLPFITKFGYFNDDWYLMYAAGAKGISVFRDIFSVDRPGRILVMMPAYWLFGQNPLYYNLSVYFFRLLSAVGFYRLLEMLWPRRREVTTSMALLFLIYPGFLSQPNAIDYQSHIVGLAAAMLSISCTVKAVLSERISNKFGLFSLSILLGWFYLWQMEWYIGFEFLRWASVFVLMVRTEGTLMQKTLRGLHSAYSTFLIPLIFLFWRLTLFTSERGATDVSAQLNQVLQSPLKTSLDWLFTLLTSTLDVVILAWIQPLLTLLSWVWTRNLLLLGLGMSTASVAIALVLLKQVENPDKSDSANWRIEAFWLGLSNVVAGLLPIILVNRYIDFTFYSRYTLVSSAGAVILLSSLIFSLKQTSLQKAVIVMLIFTASLTHLVNSQRAVQITQATRNFWWQVYWRIPNLERGTTLVENNPTVALEEDYFIWGPANLIYNPAGTNERYVQPAIYAALLNPDTIRKVLLQKGQEFDNRRSIRTYKNYRNILILSQPTTDSCVHIIDSMNPEFSRGERDSVRMIAPYSEVEHVLTDRTPYTPPQVVFGPEPAHDWCYYYEKASLARQRGDWDAVLKLADTAFKDDLTAQDEIEWIPFLQAYTKAGDLDHLTKIKRLMKKADPYVFMQACEILRSTPGISAGVMEQVEGLYCVEQ